MRRILQYGFSLIIFLSGLCCTAFAQLLDRKISLHLTEVTLQQALQKIEAESSVKFIYRDDLIRSDKKISINADSVSLKKALEEILTSFNISFKVHENESRITLRKGNSERSSSARGELPELLISGTVTDAVTGNALAGVNIIIKGSVNGTASDMNGGYNLEVNRGDVLVFSSIGFTTSEVTVTNQTVVDVALQEDGGKLEEVTVNAGYWEVESRENTGNIGRVTQKQISSQVVLNPLQSLQGRVAGVQVQQITGIPGDGFNIQVRGMNSIRGQAANDPLYIIDGVPFSSSTLFSAGGSVTRAGTNPLNSINPLDIESIEILKDADATAIYGSRGSNGVVLITTKKGRSGKTRVDVNVYSGIGTMSRQMDMLNTSQYVAMRKEAFRNDGVTPTSSNAPDLLLWDTTRYTDWKKVMLGGTASVTNAQATVSGGNANTQFLFSAGYLKQTTVFPGDFNYQKGSTHLNITHLSSDNKFSVGFSTSFIADQNILPALDITSLVFSLAPNTPVIYNTDGTLNWQNGTWTNPYGDLRKSYSTNTKNIINNLNLSYEVIRGLRIKISGGYNNLATNERNVTPIAAQNPASNPTGSSIFTSGNISTWIAEPQVDYQHSFNQGKLSLLAGMTFQQSIRERQGYIASGFINDSQLENPVAAATYSPFGIDYSEYKYNAVFGRINYNLKEKYIINITGRRDGSSRFGPDRQFANFGAIGGAWIFSNEDFVKSIPGLSFGKLRASYGITGSDQIGDYQFMDTHSSTQYTYQGGKGLFPTRLYNSDYSWEENVKMEGGVELGFFNDRLFFSASYYNNRSSNQLVGYTLPAITGFTTIQSNLPAEIQNTGVELTLSNVNIKRGAFTWTSSMNVTFPSNKLISYPNIEGSTYANTYSVGRSLYVVKKYNSQGVDPQTGLYAFEDVDRNGALSPTLDTQFNKERSTQFFGGLQNTLTYKNFELQFFFQFVKQTGNNYLNTVGLPPGFRGNQPAVVWSRWRAPGDVTDIQRFTQGGAGATAFANAINFGDGILSDASFVRLQNISLSWTMPAALSGKVTAEKIRFYVQAQNLFMFTDYRGADPETQNVKTLSPLRMITAGAQLTF